MKTKVLYAVICTMLFVSCGYDKKSKETNSVNTEKETLLTPSAEGIVKIQPNNKIMAQVGTNVWKGIAYGYGQYVACGWDTSIACSSNNGESWTSIGGVGTSQGVKEWNAVACGNERWVVVGSRGFVAHAKANDGTPMFDVIRSGGGGLTDVIFANGKFVAVGETGSTVYSTDGITWNKSSQSGLYTVTYGNGRFIGVGTIGIGSSSTDGITWKSNVFNLSDIEYETPRSIAYGNGKFVIVGWGGSAYSTDGIKWTKGPLTIVNWNKVTFSKGYFVAVGDSGNVAYSTDGVNWEYRTVGSTDYDSACIME